MLFVSVLGFRITVCPRLLPFWKYFEGFPYSVLTSNHPITEKELINLGWIKVTMVVMYTFKKG